MELSGYPDKIAVDDIETIVCYKGQINPETISGTCGEYIVYHGYDPYPEGGFYNKNNYKKQFSGQK